MRLKYVFISQYKNLHDFHLRFDGSSFIDVFVGKNGSGKSNLFEALIEIFRHLAEFGRPDNIIEFEYIVAYKVDGQDISIEWKGGKLKVNDETDRKSIGKTPLPDNVLIYYSGHNTTVPSLIERYEAAFRKRIKGANIEDSRRFIGIGPEYKSLLLAVLLAQSKGSKACDFVNQKLGVASVGTEIRIDLKRPPFAAGSLKALNVTGIEHFDPRTHYWGAEGITLEFLERLTSCIKGEFNHTNLYDAAKDCYSLTLNLELFQQRFADEEVTDVFRQFDNLKTLGMLSNIAIPLKLTSGVDATVANFSDGQFQSVYIYAIVELFKDRNCLTILDEPDAFLHPEWQFDFLRQVFEITDTAAKNNHVLMSSHSAVTLIPHDKKKIKFFDIKGSQANCYDLPKSIAIKRLSSDLIKYSEQDQLLSIINAVQIEKNLSCSLRVVQIRLS